MNDDAWQWQTTAAQPYLTTTLLEGWRHGFFTRHSEGQTPADLSVCLEPVATTYRAKQVHGRRVIKPNEFPAQVSEVASLPEADGVMSIAPHQAVWVCSADCTPVLIADAQTGQVAAVHAGWRGTALGIVPEAIRLMIAQGSQVADLRVALGPAIAGEVYQVTTHVAAEVGRSLTMTSEDDDTLIAALQDMALPPILPDPEPGRVRLDVRRVNVLQLQQMGLDPEQIEIAPHCTYQEPEQFFSYRRTYEKKVQWSGIVSV